MRIIGLISGGKDSCYAMHLCHESGHQLVGLANLVPKTLHEEDSYMYQTVGHEVIQLYSEAMDLPLFRRTISGKAINREFEYNENVIGDEVEDLFELLSDIKKELAFDGISVGAILSNYQRVRAENVCKRLGIEMISPLWNREQTQLLQDMINDGIHAILIKVAVIGLKPDQHLGKSIKEMFPVLVALKDKYGINVCGEGGEYETLTLDSPLFKKKIVLDETETVIHSNDAFATVAYLKPIKFHLENKT